MLEPILECLFSSHSYSSPLRRSTTIMRNRSHITDRLHFQTNRLKSTDSRFTPGPGTLDPNFDRLHSMLAGRVCHGLRSLLSCEGGSLPRPLESQRPGAGPADQVPLAIRDADNGVVESGLNVNDPAQHDFFSFFLKTFFLPVLVGALAINTAPLESLLVQAAPSGLSCQQKQDLTFLCLAGRFLLSRDGALARSLTGSRIGVSSLTMDGQRLAMPSILGRNRSP